MKSINIYFSLVLGVTVFVSSCKKEEDDHHDVPATIEIAAPLATGMYNQGDTVFINATVTAEAAMHGWELHLRKKADQTEVFAADAHDHAATYNISEYWINNVTSDTQMELEVMATIDHDGNTANKKVEFHCHQ